MYLMYYVDENGKRVYTLKMLTIPHFPSAACLYYLMKFGPDGKPTITAHPARFSPEDKYSRERIIIKKRFGLLPTQKAEPVC